jgi:hypothetical protein
MVSLANLAMVILVLVDQGPGGRSVLSDIEASPLCIVQIYVSCPSILLQELHSHLTLSFQSKLPLSYDLRSSTDTRP